jgi:DNA-directed RNA polymerase subunit alpha
VARLGPGQPPAQDEELQEKLTMPVEFLNLSTRCRKCMERLSITTVGELIQHTEEDLLSTPNFGRTSIAEIKNKLSELELALREE